MTNSEPQRAVFINRQHPELNFGMIGDYYESGLFYVDGYKNAFDINREDVWFDSDGYFNLKL